MCDMIFNVRMAHTTLNFWVRFQSLIGLNRVVLKGCVQTGFATRRLVA